MRKFWLILFPDTFLWIKNSTGIIYNSKNYKYFTFHRSDEINKLCDTLVDLDSLYSVEISELLLYFDNVKQWINKITSIEAGCLIEQNGQNKKLVSYYPFLRVQDDIYQIKWNHNKNKGGEIIENLHELVFYTNGSRHGSDRYFRQTYYPVRSEAFLDFNQIESFVNQCINIRLNQITFVGDIVKYKNFEQLRKWGLSNNYMVHFVLLGEDIEKDIAEDEWLNSDETSITVIINNLSVYSDLFKRYKNFQNRVTYTFPVTSIKQLYSVSASVKKAGLKSYTIIPLYTGRNRKFFEEYVYMTVDELNNVKLSKREVFANMTLNNYFFGKLTVMTDGRIYSNVNDDPLGSVDDPVYDMIYKEMTEGKTWFHVRNMKPCCDCIYQWLCPSPGNYELAIGKPDLCNVRIA